MSSATSRDGLPVGRLIKLMFVLWLAGVAMRMTILAMPPVIPLVHAELHMSETQVGLLVGLPLALFAIAAVPGSLLVARIGAKRAVVLGMCASAVVIVLVFRRTLTAELVAEFEQDIQDYARV